MMRGGRWLQSYCILGLELASCNGGGDAPANPDGSGVGGSGGSTSDTGLALASFASQIEPLLKTNCTNCHGGANPQSGIDLSTYAGAKGAANAANSAIQSGRMPPSGQLSGAMKQLFQSWVNQGAQNN
jgi:hypothetical protein